MASNYWESTQRRFWTFTKQQLALERKKMEEAERNLVSMYPLPDRRLLSIYFYHRMSTCPAMEDTADADRTVKNGQAVVHSTTSTGNSAGLRAAILRQSRNTENESRSCPSDCSIPGLQDGRVSSAH